MIKRGVGLLILLLAAISISACGSNEDQDGTVTLELFSNKVENIDTYKNLIAKFEEENPNIKIDLYSPPDAGTIIRTRLVKDDIPDMMAIGGDSLYGELADAGILRDYQDSDLLNNIQPAYVKMLEDLTESDGIYGVPYATNANGVIYNKEKFADLNLTIPETWNEFVETLEKAEQSGEIPIYFTLLDAWTGMVPWNAVAGNLEPDQFALKKNNNRATFVHDYQPVTEKLLTLLEYGHDKTYGIGYDDGNRAFANGEGLYYLQGNWAVPEIMEMNPDADLGVFAMPVSNNPEENNLVSGIDVMFTATKDTEHPEEAAQFIDFMLEEENMEQYIDEQAAFSAVEGVYDDNPVFADIRENFETGSITGFPDHFYPPGIGAENLVQEFYIKKDGEKFLKKLDNEWDKVLLRY